MPTCGTIVVRPEFDSNSVSVSSCTGGAEVTQGESVAVTATVENENPAAANATVELLVDGSREATGTVTVGANGAGDVTFDVATGALSTGDHSVTAQLSSAQRA